MRKSRHRKKRRRIKRKRMEQNHDRTRKMKKTTRMRLLQLLASHRLARSTVLLTLSKRTLFRQRTSRSRRVSRRPFSTEFPSTSTNFSTWTSAIRPFRKGCWSTKNTSTTQSGPLLTFTATQSSFLWSWCRWRNPNAFLEANSASEYAGREVVD